MRLSKIGEKTLADALANNLCYATVCQTGNYGEHYDLPDYVIMAVGYTPQWLNPSASSEIWKGSFATGEWEKI